MGAGLRKIGIHTEKVRGVKDENDAIIRLADAISGLMMEEYQRIDYAQKLSNLGRKHKTLQQV